MNITVKTQNDVSVDLEIDDDTMTIKGLKTKVSVVMTSWGSAQI